MFSIRQKVMVKLKANKSIYLIYYVLGSIAVNIMKLFIKSDYQLILFVSYGGQKYDDSPKKIYEELRKDVRFENFKFVWAFKNPDEFFIEGAELIKIDSFKYYITALKARCWVTNAAIERGLNFSGKDTLYFNTWHGTPIKKMGVDLSKTNESFGSYSKYKMDVFTVQGEYEAHIFEQAFKIQKDKFLKIGLPRNDIFAADNRKHIEYIKNKLGLPLDKKIILYAPTFREYLRDKQENCVFAPPINLDLWKKEMSEKYILIFRAHYEVVKSLNIKSDNDFIWDYSNYESLEDLMLISDILISDYSSIFFDYSIQGKPMLCFAYDYEEYKAKRGLYIELDESFYNGVIRSENELLRIIKEMSIDKAEELSIKFRDKYVEEYGNATKKSVEYIANHILG